MLFFTAQDLSLFPCPGRHPRVGRANRPFRDRGHRKLGHVFRKDPHCQRASPGRGPGLSLPGVGQKARLIHGIFRQQVSSLAQCFYVHFLWKNIGLPVGQINEPFVWWKNIVLFCSFQHLNLSRNLEGLYDLTRHPSRALYLGLYVASGTSAKNGHLRDMFAYFRDFLPPPPLDVKSK